MTYFKPSSENFGVYPFLLFTKPGCYCCYLRELDLLLGVLCGLKKPFSSVWLKDLIYSNYVVIWLWEGWVYTPDKSKRLTYSSISRSSAIIKPLFDNGGLLLSLLTAFSFILYILCGSILGL